MYRIHHGCQGYTDATDAKDAAKRVECMLKQGLTNVLVTRNNVEVDGRTESENQPDDRYATIVLEIPIVGDTQ